MQHFITTLSDYLTSHPGLAVLVVFLLAASESIVVIGALIPGTAVLLALSALIGLGHLPLWPILAAATLGAVAGDGLSYWIGHRHRTKIAAMWPFSRYPEVLSKGNVFFERHGGKSILIGRFTPGMRAIIPVIAGSSGMPPARFYTANIASALIWAPAHILPGAAAGLGLGMAGHASLRLAGLALILLIAAVAAIYLLRLLVVWILPLAERLRHALAERLRARPQTTLTRAILAVIAPNETLRPILLIGLPLAAVIFAFASLIEEVIEQGALARADTAISNALTGLRTDPGDDVMTFVTAFGDWPVITATAAALVLYLALRHQRRLAAGVAVIMMLATTVASTLKVMLAVPRPNAYYEGVQAFSFPSGHSTSAMTLFGLLAWFALRGLPWRAARWLTGLFAAITTTIAVSRLYLGAHWPSDVLGGLLLGMALVLIFTLTFRHRFPAHAGTGLALALMVFAGFGTAYSLTSMPRAEARYTRIQPPPVTLTKAQWLEGGWRDLPQARTDLAGGDAEPIILQWADTAAALQARLAPDGWTPAQPLTLSTLGRYVAATRPADLPVIPRLEDGHRPVLTLVRPDAAGREVLSIWASGFTAGGTPILIAARGREVVSHPLPFLTLTDAKPMDAATVLEGSDIVQINRVPPLSLGPR